MLLWNLLLPLIALAGPYVEPSLGEEYGKISRTITTNGVTTTSDTNQSGFTFGLKGGWQQDLFYGGLQYEQAFGGQVKDGGVFAGLFVQKVECWAAYLFSAKDAIGKGSGFEIGVGVPILRVALNLAFSARKYSSLLPGAYPGSTGFSAKRNTGALTLSVPLRI